MSGKSAQPTGLREWKRRRFLRGLSARGFDFAFVAEHGEDLGDLLMAASSAVMIQLGVKGADGHSGAGIGGDGVLDERYQLLHSRIPALVGHHLKVLIWRAICCRVVSSGRFFRMSSSVLRVGGRHRIAHERSATLLGLITAMGCD